MSTKMYPASTAWEISRLYEHLTIPQIKLVSRIFESIDEGVINGWIGVDVNLPKDTTSVADLDAVVSVLLRLGYKIIRNGEGTIEGFHHIYIDWNSSTQTRVLSYKN